MVSETYTSSDPWAVVVVFFDAYSTVQAVKRSRRSQNVTGFAIRKLVMLIGFVIRMTVFFIVNKVSELF
jgi:hypothetical protein